MHDPTVFVAPASPAPANAAAANAAPAGRHARRDQTTVDEGASRLDALARELSGRTGRRVGTFRSGGHDYAIEFDGLSVTCRPTVDLDPSEPWLFAVAGHGIASIEIHADALDPRGSVIRCGNLPEAVQRILELAAGDRRRFPHQGPQRRP